MFEAAAMTMGKDSGRKEAKKNGRSRSYVRSFLRSANTNDRSRPAGQSNASRASTEQQYIWECMDRRSKEHTMHLLH